VVWVERAPDGTLSADLLDVWDFRISVDRDLVLLRTDRWRVALELRFLYLTRTEAIELFKGALISPSLPAASRTR
jgi:hypothetical protein